METANPRTPMYSLTTFETLWYGKDVVSFCYFVMALSFIYSFIFQEYLNYLNYSQSSQLKLSFNFKKRQVLNHFYIGFPYLTSVLTLTVFGPEIIPSTTLRTSNSAFNPC